MYADSSALVKLVVDEAESDALRRHVEEGGTLITSGVARVEIARAAFVASGDRASSLARTSELLAQCVVVHVTERTLRAAAATVSERLRALDAIHLVSAQRVEADEFLVYDRRLAEAAEAAGLHVTAPGVA